MKILNYIAGFLLPLAIINSNETMALKTKKAINNQNYNINNQNYNSSVDGVMKFYNYSGGNMCSLASLNQCLSALNPGNNEILKQFVQKYNNIANNKNYNREQFAPQHVLGSILNYLPDDNKHKKILLTNEPIVDANGKVLLDGERDIDERYMSLISISEMLGSDISTVNNYTTIQPGDKMHPIANTLREEIIRQNKELQKHGHPGANYNDVMNLVLQFDWMNEFNLFKGDIINANDIVIDNNNFSLSAVAFRRISNMDAKINKNMSQGDQRPFFANGSNTHFFSAKKLANGKWALIDSLPVKIEIYNSFKSLMNRLGDEYLPRMVFFSKTQNNNLNNNKLKNANKNNKIKINKDNMAEVNNNKIVKNKKQENININKGDVSKNKKQKNININGYNVNNIKNKPININKNNVNKNSGKLNINMKEYDINKHNINKNSGKLSINMKVYDINDNSKYKPINKKNKDINKIIDIRINKLKTDIENVQKQKHDSVNFLITRLNKDKKDIKLSIDGMNNLYNDKEMRNLIMKNSNSNDIYDFLCKFNCGYLFLKEYKEIISDIFNKKAILQGLSIELFEINKLKLDIEYLRKQKDDNVELLKSCLKAGNHDVIQSIDTLEKVYDNKEMRSLIMKDSNSNKIDKFFNDFGYEHLNDYKEIISDIFNNKARLKELETEVSKMKN